MNIGDESLLAQISPQLRRLEKRDWELWAIVSGTGILVSLGLSAIILPSALLKNDNIHFEITVSRSLDQKGCSSTGHQHDVRFHECTQHESADGA
jgi:hypothetical protein